jgi:hypothetical protein
MRTIYTACGEEIRVEGGGGDREREYGRVTDDGGRGIPAFVEAETVAALDTRMSAAETMMAAADTHGGRGRDLDVDAQTTVAATEMCVRGSVMCGVPDGGSARGRRTVVQVGGGGGRGKMEVRSTSPRPALFQPNHPALLARNVPVNAFINH